ncbi:MAG: protein-export chaperone SecB [Woeseiaceae bacterium]|nr:protein-export chaperone SecB [Woeseiaceae bacterium]
MAEQEQAQKQLAVTKIYTKDCSFESPQSPAVFNKGEWNPQTNLNLRSAHTALEGDTHEIVLTITVEAKEDDKTLFLVELQQAGIFEIAGYEGEELAAVVGSFCPNILFPYARESIASMIQKGGFPEFVLQPINFDALYLQAKQQQQQQGGAAAEAH